MAASMRAAQVAGQPPNSAAVPLPTAFWELEIPLPAVRPNHHQMADIPNVFDVERTLLEAAARFVPCLRDKRTGSATAGPRHAWSRGGAGGWGLRVGAQAVDEVSQGALPPAPPPVGRDDGLDPR